MSVSDTDRVQDAVEPSLPPIASQDHSIDTHEQPADVSFTEDKPSSDSDLGNSLLLPNDDASNGDVSSNANPSLSGSSAKPHEAENGHPPIADAGPQVITAHSKEIPEIEAVSDNATDSEDALLGSVAIASDSVAAENVAAAVTAENESVKEADNVLVADVIDYATTSEHQGLSTSESVTVLAEESLADKTISDSVTEILPPVVGEKEEGKDHGLADKPDVEVVEPAVGGESAIAVEGSLVETIHTHAEEVAQFEEAKDVIPVENEGVVGTMVEPSSNEEEDPVSTTEVLKEEADAIGKVPEEQLQVETATELDEPEGESGVKQEEIAHEAEPVAAEVNTVGDNSHEAVEQPIVEEANGNEATLEQLDEQPEVTATPFVEESQVDGVMDDVGGEGVTEIQANVEPAMDEVRGEVDSEHIPLPVEAGPLTEDVVEEVQVSEETLAPAIEEVPASSEAVAGLAEETVTEIAREEESVPAEPEAIAEVAEEVTAAVETETTSEEVPVPVSAEAVAEDVLVHVDVDAKEASVSVEAEPVAELVSEEAPVVVEATSAVEVTSNETAAPLDAEPIVNTETMVTVDAEPVVEVAGEETSTVSETINATSGEAPTPIEAGIIAGQSIPVETEPSTEVTEEAASIVAEVVPDTTSQDVSAPLESEPTHEVVDEETSTAIESEVSKETPEPASAEVEPSALVADEEHSAAAEVASEEASESNSGVELATVTAIHEDIPAQAAEAEVLLTDVGSEAVPEETQVSEVVSDKFPAEVNPEPVAEISVSEPIPVEVQEVQYEDNSVETEGAPIGVTREEIAVQETLDVVESLTGDAPEQIADAANPTLDGQDVSETGIKDDAEVALEDAPVTLATNAIEETLLAVSPKSPYAEVEQEALTPAENGHLSESAVPAEDRAVGPLTGLKTDTLYIQTALDTTPFTPIVDSGIELKEQELQSSHLLSIAEEIERPKSPWSPSFRVTTIGHKEWPEEVTEKAPIENEFQTEEFADVVPTAAPVVTGNEVAEQGLFTTVTSEDSVDSQPLESIAETWTPSYSVHSQGTMTQTNTELTEVAAEEQQVADVVMSAETVTSELQVEPDVNDGMESEMKAEDGNEQVPETVAVQEESGNNTEESTDVVSTDTTEPPMEETATTLTDEDMNKASEASLHEEVSADSLVDTTPDPSAKVWTPSYSVHAQGTSTILEDVTTPAADTEALEAQTSSDSKEPVVEFPILSVSMESTESAILDAPAESWTPSYSVHSQGSPMVVAKELDEADSVAEPLADSGISSYSVHSQGTPLVASKDLEEPPASDLEPPEATVAVESTESGTTQDPWTSQFVSEQVSVAETAHDLQSDDVADSTIDLQDERTNKDAQTTLAAIVAPVIAFATVEAAAETLVMSEQSTKLWTPSYAIHSQGSPLLSPVTLKDDPEQVMETSALGDALQLNISSEVIPESHPWVPSYTVSVHGTPAVEKTEADVLSGIGVEHSATSEVDAATSSIDKTSLPVLSVEVPVINMGSNNATTDVSSQSWTPSYSMTQQGSDLSREAEDKHKSQPITNPSSSSELEPELNEVQEPNAVQLRPGYNVAGAEDFAKNEKFMLFGLRAIVAYLWVLPNWLSMTRSPSESSHSRQGSSSSSSSSKFFPGGWFTPKPNEGRASFDVAQGEFAPSPKVATTTDVFETLNVQNEAGPSTNTVIDGDGVEGQKRKWCIVM